jgi:hypothetical protein
VTTIEIRKRVGRRKENVHDVPILNLIILCLEKQRALAHGFKAELTSESDSTHNTVG